MLPLHLAAVAISKGLQRCECDQFRSFYGIRIKPAQQKQPLGSLEFRSPQVDFRAPFNELDLLFVELVCIEADQIGHDFAERAPVVEEGKDDRANRSALSDYAQRSLVEFCDPQAKLEAAQAEIGRRRGPCVIDGPAIDPALDQALAVNRAEDFGETTQIFQRSAR